MMETTAETRGRKRGEPKAKVIIRLNGALRADLNRVAAQRGLKTATLLTQIIRERLAAEKTANQVYKVSGEAALFFMSRGEPEKVASNQISTYLTLPEKEQLYAMADEVDINRGQMITCLLTDYLKEQNLL